MLARLLRDGWRMLWPLLLAAGVCWLTLSLWPLLATLALLLLWQVWQKWRLARWLARGELLDPPHAGGLWEDYYTRLMHLFRAEQRAQLELRSIIERARHCADSLDEGVLLLNRKGEMEYSNQTALALLDLNGRDHGEVLVKLLRDPDFSHYLEARDFRQPLTLPAPLGGLTLRYRATDLDNGDLLLRVEDITHLHTLENLRRDFVANISHELKTPLTVFKGYLELLQDQLADKPRLGTALANMDTQCARMEALVRDLLLLAQLESTQVKQRAPISPKALLEAMLPVFVHQAEQKQQQLRCELADTSSLHGVADELESAFGNLLANAIKYSGEGCTIQLRLWQDDKGVHLAVSDNGPGIEARHLPHLTERFYRTDTSRQSGTGGTGLGLAIVKHVLQRHQGHLSIDSTPGKGSCFTCHFHPATLSD